MQEKICYNLYYSSRGIKVLRMTEYMTAAQAAKKWDISQRRVQVLCSEGRIEGVFKLGENWAIPVNSPKPNDARCKMTEDTDE